MAEQKEVSEPTQLRLAIYQARIYSTLIALGHSVVTEISGVSSAPKTKAYETLKKLSINGVVDFQPGQTPDSAKPLLNEREEIGWTRNSELGADEFC